ncbi:hypothetical protein CTAYLR_006980 [Chrysophaeum taylorii]|uniref:Major facilitator superfamily (MFS) profile domain-containing protein n=1 Tax=Chrysophaeum taylorii TaxID=2483200 RepID=A0AAD7XLX3_9STRA|nr:hypothetical protein CTAYLR_006980 [Chrysophaeum taylorii]
MESEPASETEPLLSNRDEDHLSLTQFTVLAATAALCNASSDMYVPLLPTVKEDLHASWLMISLSLILNWTFSGLTGPAWVTLSVARGRLVALACGLSMFLAGTIISGLAASAQMLVVGRIVQGFGESSARAIAEAIVTDVYVQVDERNEALAFLSSTYPVVIICAPALGGLVGAALGWRYVFAILFVWGTIQMLSLALLRETQPRVAAKSSSSSATDRGRVSTGWGLLSRSISVRVVAGWAFNLSANSLAGTMLSLYPYTLENIYGFSTQVSGLIIGSVGFFCVVGGVCNTCLHHYLDVVPLLRVGMTAYTTVTLGLAVVTALFGTDAVPYLTDRGNAFNTYWFSTLVMYAFQLLWFFNYPAILTVLLSGLGDEARALVVGINSGIMIIGFGISALVATMVARYFPPFGAPNVLYGLLSAWGAFGCCDYWIFLSGSLPESDAGLKNAAALKADAPAAVLTYDDATEDGDEV